MPKIFTFLLLLFALCSNAQVVELPLESNNLLTGKQPITGKTSWYTSTPGQRDATFNCVLPGGEFSLELDTAGLGNGHTVTVLKNPSTGTVQITDQHLLVFKASATTDFALDTVLVKLCNADGSKCNEFDYYFATERASANFTQPTVSVGENIKSYYTIPLNQTPSAVVSLQLSGNAEGTKAVGFIESPDQFVFYSGRGGYNGQIKIKACDAYCVCDEYIYNIKVTADTLDLPFVDDFSYPGPYPDPALWINDDVFINNTFGVKAPSLGVATFDGLNERGRPYQGGHGTSDYLTSRQLNLGKYNLNSNVYLSYYVQPQGNGNAPESIDSLLLEFKDKDGNWVLLQGLVPGFQLTKDTFKFFSISITNEKYLYDGFQFRFVNQSDNTGMLDNWNVDYISLTAGIIPSLNTSDIAFSLPPKGLLKNYTAIPWQQFRNFEAQELNMNGNTLNLSIDMYNFFNKTETADPSSLKISEKNTGTVLVNNLTLLELPPLAPEDQRNLTPGFHHFDATKDLPGFVDQLKNNFGTGNDFRFITEYKIDNSSEINLPAIKRNNTVLHETNMSYYYAYDDGTAESNIGVKKNGSRCAVKFHANVNDTLRAIQLYIPRVFNNVSNQLFNLLVWKGSLNSEPIHSDFLLKPVYLDNLFDTIQGFTTYVLMNEELSGPEPAFIPAGDFYVGWQQATDDAFPIPIGFDKNNPDAAKNTFVNLEAGWQSLESLNFNGAVMIRPVLGNTKLNHTPDLVGTKEQHNAGFEIFPNPASDRLFIYNKNQQATIEKSEIYNMQGMLKKKIDDRTNLSISDLENGMYIIKITDRQSKLSSTIKFIVSH